MLLDSGADVNAQGGHYGSALYAASLGGHERVAQMLLEYGADPNVLGGFYDSALRAASSAGHENIAQILLDHGADFKAQGGEDGNALEPTNLHSTIVGIVAPALHVFRLLLNDLKSIKEAPEDIKL
jgi:ankyrin repeat protein